MTNLTTEPKPVQPSVLDAAGRRWTKKDFFWVFTDIGTEYSLEWDVLVRFLGPIRSV